MGMKARAPRKRQPKGPQIHYTVDLGGETYCGGKLRANQKDHMVDDWYKVNCADCKMKQARAKPRIELCFRDTGERGNSIARCDVADGVPMHVHYASDWMWVDCKQCMALAPPKEQFHWFPKGEMKKPDYVCGQPEGMAGWDREEITCLKCIEFLDQISVPDVLEDSARIIITNAIIAARKNGYKLKQHGCRKCRQWITAEKSICVVCAIKEYRGIKVPRGSNIEDELARIFALPYDWILDVISGFDSDRGTPIYKGASGIGRRIWRRYGKQKARRRA